MRIQTQFFNCDVILLKRFQHEILLLLPYDILRGFLRNLDRHSKDFAHENTYFQLALSLGNWDNICTVRKGRRGSNDQKRQTGRTRGETRRVGDLGVLWLQIRDSSIKRAFQKTPFPTSTILWDPGGQVEKILLKLMCPVDDCLIDVQTSCLENEFLDSVLWLSLCRERKWVGRDSNSQPMP